MKAAALIVAFLIIVPVLLLAGLGIYSRWMTPGATVVADDGAYLRAEVRSRLLGFVLRRGHGWASSPTAPRTPSR